MLLLKKTLPRALSAASAITVTRMGAQSFAPQEKIRQMNQRNY